VQVPCPNLTIPVIIWGLARQIVDINKFIILTRKRLSNKILIMVVHFFDLQDHFGKFSLAGNQILPGLGLRADNK
jgi:hypothetical protein